MIRRRAVHWRVSPAGTATGTCAVAWRSSLAGAFSQCDTFLVLMLFGCVNSHGNCQQRTAAAMSQVCPSLQTHHLSLHPPLFSSPLPLHPPSIAHHNTSLCLILTPHLISSCHDLNLYRSLFHHTTHLSRGGGVDILQPPTSILHLRLSQSDLLTR